MRKRGIGAGERVVAINAPEHYPELLEGLPQDASIGSRVATDAPSFTCS